MRNILLDTCAVMWIGYDELPHGAVADLERSKKAKEDVFISPVSAWEIGMLVALKRFRVPVEPHIWLDHFVETSECRIAKLPSKVLIASSFLPGLPPRDPADRIIVATAREYGYRIMTRDRAILDYAEQGHVQAIAC
jgi:PIN domain nuclease of toxin-antitoxin system